MSGDGSPGRATDGLASLERKLHLVRDCVAGVVHGYDTGFYLYGAGGMGKSYTVLKHLTALEATYHLFNTRMTAKGLFQTLEKAPDAIHVLEDMERLTRDPDAQSLLRSALWAQPGHDRVVKWTTASKGEERFIFRGGLILLANRPMADLPELRAVATRIAVHRLDVTEDELVALMRDLASRGYEVNGKVVIRPEECHTITEYLLAESRTAGCPLDLRLQVHAFKNYLQWEADQTVCSWQDLVSARVREAAHHFRHEANTKPREDRLRERRDIVREIMQQTSDAKEQERLYEKETGRSRADFFRRKREVQSGEFDVAG
jgi:hypothetical protein